MTIKRKNLQGISWILLVLGWAFLRYGIFFLSWPSFRDFLMILGPAIIPGFLIFFRKNSILYEFNITDFLRYFLFMIFAFVGIVIIRFFTISVLIGLSDGNFFN